MELMSASARASRLATVLVIAAVAWHLLTVIAPPRQKPPRDSEGRDYASYHYAARAAWRGENPYDKATLDGLAREERTRSTVHPYLYPPPFLLLVAGAPWVGLQTGFVLWGILNELALLVAALALVHAWQPLSTRVVPLLAVFVALSWPVAYGAELGQANLLVLGLLAVAFAAEPTRPRLAGACLGVACMLKMSPALVVLLWVLERRYEAVVATVVAALALALLSLGLVAWPAQWDFYTRVLPGLGAGDYNGLVIKIGMFGNHSLPNVAHQLFPSSVPERLSGAARVVSGLVTVGGLAALGWRFREPTPDPWRRSARFAAVLVAMLLVPVYTYAHHLVFALPAMVLACLALLRGRLVVAWAAPVGVACAVVAYPLPHLKSLATWLGARSPAHLVIQELPFLALCVLLASTIALESRVRPTDQA